MSYTKPMILEAEDLAEGIFAASGSTDESADLTASWTLNQCASHDGYYVYSVKATNNTGKSLSTIRISVTTNNPDDTVTSAMGGVVSISGNTLTITYTGTFEAGYELNDTVYFENARTGWWGGRW